MNFSIYLLFCFNQMYLLSDFFGKYDKIHVEKSVAFYKAELSLFVIITIVLIVRIVIGISFIGISAAV